MPADRIAAITFTEKAAAELTDRIRGRARGGRPGRAASACAAALAVLDRAAIGTLHAFAQRILNEHPIEAGLPPRIDVLDEIASAGRLRGPLGGLRRPAARRPRDGAPAPAAPRHRGPARPPAGRGRRLRRQLGPGGRAGGSSARHHPARRRRRAAGRDRRGGGAGRVLPRPRRQAARQHLEDVVPAVADELRAAADEDTRARASSWRRSSRSPTGKAKNWLRPTKDEVTGRLDALAATAPGTSAVRVQEAVLQTLADGAGPLHGGGRRRAAPRRRARVPRPAGAGPRRAARPGARRGRSAPALAARYQRLLLDEFQDTDPIQVELAVLIASDDPAAGGQAVGGGRDPAGGAVLRRRPEAVDLPVPPGRHRHVPPGPRRSSSASSEALTRTSAPARPSSTGSTPRSPRLIVEEAGLAARLPAARRRCGPAPPVGPAGRLLRRATTAPDRARRRRLAGGRGRRRRRRADPGHAPRRWSVATRSDGVAGAARGRDMAILLPARTSLPFLEAALERGRGALPGRDLVARLRHPGGAGPADDRPGRRGPDRRAGGGRRAAHAGVRLRRRRPLHVEGAPRRAGGTTRARSPEEAPADHPVARGLAWLGELHRERLWLSPSAVLERIVRDRRLLELAVVERRPRDLWRRLRFVLDQCRAWEEAGGVDAAGLPALGRGAVGRGRPGGRDGAAGERRRRRAHPHRPRGQGAGVPDRRAVGAHHRAAVVEPRGRGAVPGRGGVGHQAAEGREHGRLRADAAPRRADGPPRAAAAAVRGRHAGP